jgi:hypothetical protein
MQTFFANQLVEILPSKHTGPQETDHCAGYVVETTDGGREVLIELKGTGQLWWIPAHNVTPAFKVTG